MGMLTGMSRTQIKEENGKEKNGNNADDDDDGRSTFRNT